MDGRVTDADEAAFAAWEAGIAAEAAFWARWLATGGAEWPANHAARMDAGTAAPPWLLRLLRGQAGTPARVLDVGAGPASSLGRATPPGLAVDLIACDALAPVYDAILARLALRPPTLTRFALAEALSLAFPRDSFDVVHCRNALDHALDPLAGLREMLAVLRPGGVLVLDHYANEAEREGYGGFHRHNFDVDAAGRFVIWRPGARLDVAAALDGPLEIAARGGPVVRVRITKRGPMPYVPPDAARAARMEAAVRRHAARARLTRARSRAERR